MLLSRMSVGKWVGIRLANAVYHHQRQRSRGVHLARAVCARYRVSNGLVACPARRWRIALARLTFNNRDYKASWP